VRLSILACLLSLTAAHALADGSSAESCGECQEQIQALEEKIGALPEGDARLPDLLLRLGGLHQEASEFYKSPQRYRDTSASGLERFTKAKEALQKAVEQYRKLIEEHPRSKRREEALSILVQLYLGSSRTQKALEAYEQLLKEHPKSRLLPAMHFAVGEHLFVRSKGQPEKLEQAREAYKKAAGFPNSPVQLQALAMQGWCSFYLNDLKDTQAAWMAAVGSYQAKARRKSVDARDRELIEPLILDYVKVFARAGDVQRARGDIGKLTSSPDERIALLMLLDLVYREGGSGKEREAAVTLGELDKDCKAGRVRACNALGLLYMEGAGVETDKPRAALLFEKACRSKSTVGCRNFCDPEVAKASATSQESRTAGLREEACINTLSLAFGDEAEAQAFWEPLELLGRRSPTSFSRMLGNTQDTPLSQMLKGIDDRHRERMALYSDEEPEEELPKPSPKPSVDISLSALPEVDQREPSTPTGRMLAAEIRSVIFSHQGEVRWCYETALTRKPSLEGRFSVKFVVSADGSVSSSEAGRSTLEDPAMESCIVERVKTWRFSPLDQGGEVIVDYPFVFKQLRK
jgi:TonB family protein